MSYKYRFIFSFVILEAFFIILIVSLNHITLKNSADKLIKEKVQSNTAFLEELVKVPMSVFDLANLDDLVDNSVKYMNSVVILDKQNRILSSSYSYDYLTIDEFINIKKSRDISHGNKSYTIVYKEINELDTHLGSMFIVFDNTLNNKFIDESKKDILWIIIAEILISTFLAFFFGISLTRKLTTLSDVAKRIGKEEKTLIPYLNTNDEIGKLSKSLNRMKINLHRRNKVIKDANEQLKKQKNDLVSANRVKDDFMANMSHELKTPLNSINVLSSIMKNNSNKNLTEKDIKNLGIINSCGKDLLNLINDVLDVSKLEAGKVNVNNSEIKVNYLILELYDMFAEQFKNKNVEFCLDYDENINTIYSDERKISQIVKNLLSNALKFTTKGKVSLTVKQDENNIIVVVEDNGIGIKSDELKDLFDRFKQVDASISRKHLGSGLGLSISRNLAELLNASIDVQSEFGKGSTFTLKLPKNINETDMVNKKVKNDKKDEENFKSKEEMLVVEKTKKRKEILIYNNNPIVFIGLIIKLKKENDIINADTEKNFFSILDEKKESKIDTIIVDIDKLSEVFINKLLEYDNKDIIVISSNEVNNNIKSRVKELVLKPIDLSKINGII
ncbi:sensor histidine kinase [Arcobacter peruensis]|uniref:sensor histidine kinase n=1 Tax=Arcobacter peruensis TaxID=2320140 RepID=UPI000F09013D|nr:HAMP domain-containing sensor histidine kinase [Arcobacter peruensis]